MRTTIDIDDPILEELKQLQKEEGKTLGRLVSELLSVALKKRQDAAGETRRLRWTTREMGGRYDLSDRDAILDAMDEDVPE